MPLCSGGIGGGTDAVPDQHACHGTLAHGHEGPDLGYHHCGLLKPLETAVVPPVVINLAYLYLDTKFSRVDTSSYLSTHYVSHPYE
jgi:hypothetical protein